MTHDDLRELVALYALDAVDASERQLLDSHWASCTECADALQANLQAAGHLGLTAPPRSPSVALRERLLALATPQLAAPPSTPTRRHRRLRWLRLRYRAPRSEPERRVGANVVLAATTSTAASGEVAVSSDGRSARLVVRGLAQPGTAVYQLWVIVAGTPAPLNAFRPDAGGLALVQVQADLSKWDAFAISLEPQPGNLAPAGPILLASA